MRAKSVRVTARIASESNRNIEKIFDKLGMTVSEGIELFLRQVESCQGLPFKVSVPNEETCQAMAEAQDKAKLASFATPVALFEELGIA